MAGRPNVGKSALFNRIAGRRIAIVHDESGVTRDRIVQRVNCPPPPFDLVDTGGVSLAPGATAPDSIAAGVLAQVEAALADAGGVILVVNAQTGLHPVDADVARLVRRAGLPCQVAVNKCDIAEHDLILSDFASLGFPLHPVSALHKRGIEALMEEATADLPPEVVPPVDRPLKVAVVGRPNAGKSSYINRLLRQPRVIVSEIAGTTRDSIEIPFTIGSGPGARHYVLVDTAGMRHLHSIDNAVERFSLMRAERSIAEADVVALIMDAQGGPTTQDKHIAALIQKERKGCVMVVNKWDIAMAQGMTQTSYEPALRAAMPYMEHCPLLFLSALSGYNVRQSVEAIDEVAEQISKTLPTGQLNRVLAEAAERTNMPGSGRRHLKIYYATQTGTAPQEIRVFVNDVKLATGNFTAFLVRALRESFGLRGASVTIRYRARPRAGAGAGETPAPRRAAAATGRGNAGRKRPRRGGAR